MKAIQKRVFIAILTLALLVSCFPVFIASAKTWYPTPPKDYKLPYYVYVEKGSHTMSIYGRDVNGKYSCVVRRYSTATGRTAGKTPVGEFKLGGRERWHNFGVYAQYLTYIKNTNVMVHSALYSSKKIDKLLPASYNVIGTNASAGCMRTTCAAAYFVYKNCAAGTIIKIVNNAPKGTSSTPPADLSSSTKYDPSDPLKPNGKDSSLVTPMRLTMSKTSASRIAKTKLTLSAKISPIGANSQTKISWKSSNTKVATVSGGVVTAVAAGKVTITAKTANGKSATCTLTVRAAVAPTSVTLNRTSLSLKTGGTYTLKATIAPSTANTGTALTWTSSNTSIAKVDSKGKITAVAAGTATITVKVANGKKAACVVKVYKPVSPTGVRIDKDNFSMFKGDSITLKVVFSPAGANTNTALTWTSSKPSVAKVDSKGRLTAAGNGKATITVKTANGKTDNVVVTVTTAVYPTGITLNKSKLALDVGGTFVLSATIKPSNTNINNSLTWTTSDASVAKVNTHGMVTAVAAGTATITVKTLNGKTATCLVTVKAKISPSKVTLNFSKLSLYTGDNFMLAATIEPQNANINTSLTFTTSNAAVATVNLSGMVTAVAVGTATITVKTLNGKTATCLVTVK